SHHAWPRQGGFSYSPGPVPRARSPWSATAAGGAMPGSATDTLDHPHAAWPCALVCGAGTAHGKGTAWDAMLLLGVQMSEASQRTVIPMITGSDSAPGLRVQPPPPPLDLWML